MVQKMSRGSDYIVSVSLLHSLINSIAIFFYNRSVRESDFFAMLIVMLEFYSAFKINLSCGIIKFKAPLNFSEQMILYLIYP